MNFKDISLLQAFDKPYFYELRQKIIKLKGKEALDFLQKMSTNDCGLLKQESTLASTFLNHKGRIVDHVHIFKLASDEFLLLSSLIDSKLYEWIENYHFREEFLAEICNDFLPYVLIHEDFKIEFSIKKPEQSFLRLDEDTFQSLRIASMISLAPNEINENFMPQEVGLEKYISSNKGCYIGQEVIAKSLSFQKNKRYLKGFILTEEEYIKARLEQEKYSSIAPYYIKGMINALGIVNLK